MGRLGVFLSGLLLCCATAQAEVRNYDTMIASGELKVAVYQDFAPYSFEDQGQPRGVDVELAQALAEALGVSLQLIWAPPGEKLDDDLRDYIWRGSPLRHQQLADLMMRVPYDQRLRQLHIDTPGLAVVLETVGREILVHRHLQFASGDDRVVVAHLRLGRRAPQQQATKPHGKQTHGRHSSTCTLSR